MFATHQPSRNEDALQQSMQLLGCSTPHEAQAVLRELPHRFDLSGASFAATDNRGASTVLTLGELIQRTLRNLADGQYTLALDDIRQIVKFVDATRIAAERVAERAAHVPEPLTTITRAAGTATNTALIDFFAARGLAHRLPESRLLDLLTRQGDSAELRRCFAASELPHTDRTSPYLPTAADWLEVPTVHTQAQLPSWCKALANALNVPAEQQRIANALDKLITAHASSGRYLRAYWAHALRCRIASPGVESLYAPDEYTCAVACGALVTGGVS